MKTSQLLELLRSFTSREMKKLEDMLKSPYFNHNPRCQLLLDWIKKEVLKEGKEFDKELVFKLIYPEKEHWDSTLSVLMSKLLDLGEQALVLEQLRMRPHTRDYLLMKSLREKGHKKRLAKIGHMNLQKLNNKKKPTREDYNNRYLITNLLYEMQVMTSVSKKQKPEDVATTLDAFYLSHRLPLTYEMLNLREAVAVNYQQVLLNEVLGLSKVIDFSRFHLIGLYHQSIILLKQRKEVCHFSTFLTALDEHGPFVPREELHSLYVIAQNYCVLQIIDGKRAFYQHLFHIYRKMVLEKILFISKYIPSGLLKNIISLSCQINAYDWAHEFLATYSAYLEPETRVQTFNYYEATIFFYQKDFHKAQVLLAQTESKDLVFEVDRRFVLLKIYYELREYEALLNLLHAFNGFIRSNKGLAQNMKSSYLNFAKTVKQLAKIWHHPTPSKLKKIQEKLTTYKEVSDKKWLEEKTRELEEKTRELE